MKIDHAKLTATIPALFVILWSTGYLGSRFARPYVDPMTFSALRFACVIVLLFVVIHITRSRFPRAPRMWCHLAVSGVLIHGCFIAGMFYAITSGVNVGVAALIGGVQPLLTAVVAALFLGEILRVRDWCGFVLGFIGLALVVAKSFDSGALTLHGFLTCVVGLCGITFGTIYQKRFVIDVDLWSGSVIQFAAALIPCGLWALLFEAGRFEWNATTILTMGWMVVALSVGAIGLLFYMIRHGAISKISSLFYLVPALTVLEAYLIFDETMTPLQLAGVVITAVGVALINTANLARPPR